MNPLQTHIRGLTLENPVMNASGIWCTTLEELNQIGHSQSGAIVTKSMTLKERNGNPEPRFAVEEGYSVNSMGLPNPGVDYYCQHVKNLERGGKPVIASIAGFSVQEYTELMARVARQPFDAVEVNLSCPNLESKGIFAYDLETASTILEKLRGMLTAPMGVKLPPYGTRNEISQTAKRFVELGVDFVTLVNSYPLGCAIDADTRKLKIAPNGGVGGLGGKALKPIALGQVLLFAQESDHKLAIIGVGGVDSGRDVIEYLTAGASAVQIATALHTESPSIFKRINKELLLFMKEKHIASLSDIIGTVKSAQ